MPIYTGIGSRETPKHILYAMMSIARVMAKHHFLLRSGGASGADDAFEMACSQAGGLKEIHLPWDGFNGRKADHESIFAGVSAEAYDLAAQYHPNWGACSTAAMTLHARNGYQILGRDLNTPSDFVVCYTRGGYAQGGTGQAIRLARAYNIPVFDLGTDDALERLDAHVTQLLEK